jgi:hypothetical protein
MLPTERCSGVFITPVSYLVGHGFKFRPGDSYPEFVVFSVPPGEYRDGALKLSHDRFLPNSFQFIITYHPFI